MKIGSKEFKKFWLKYVSENCKFVYTKTGFGWVRKSNK